MTSIFLGLAPVPAVALQKVIRCLRSPASYCVIRKIPRLANLPSVDDWIHQGPRELDPVLSGKQCRIPFDAILEEGFVGFGRTAAKGLLVL